MCAERCGRPPTLADQDRKVPLYTRQPTGGFLCLIYRSIYIASYHRLLNPLYWKCSEEYEYSHRQLHIPYSL